MSLRRRSLAVLALAGVLAVSGCADGGAQTVEGEDSGTASGPASGSGSGSGSGSASSPTAGESATEQTSPDDAVVEIQITIAGGSTTPAGERVQVEAGQPIRLVVDSDVPDELHLHAAKAQTFDVTVGQDQVFEFSIDTPGVYELESHVTHQQVISLEVRP